MKASIKMNRAKKASRLTFFLVAGLAISLTVNVILSVIVMKQNNDSDKYLYDPNYALGKNNSEIISEVTEPDQVLEIPLRLVKLHYAAELKDQIAVDVEERESGAVIRFSALRFADKLELFSFILTPEKDAEGYALGILKNTQYGDLYVMMHMNEQTPEIWTEEEYSEICSLQERVNDIIIQFYGDERFVPNR